METSMAERLEQAVETLTELIALTRRGGLKDSAQFLAMAKLHLQLDLYGVSEEEFRALCETLEGKRPPRTRRGSPHARTRRDGQLRQMKRAWLCPQDAPATGRRRAGQ